MNQGNENQAAGKEVSASVPSARPRGRYAVIGLDVPGAEIAIRLELGEWKQRSGSAFETAPREIKEGDHYRLLWVMASGLGQIRMYAESKAGLYLYTGFEEYDRWDAVDDQVEKAIGKTIANIPAALSRATEAAK